MKNSWRNSFIACFAAMMVLVSCGRSNDHAAHEESYTCPMHPTVISDRPGTCPACGMDLVRKARPGEEVEVTEELARLLKSTNEATIASIKTIKGEYKSVVSPVEAQGIVTYDTKNMFTISSRVDGRLEKVHLKYPFQAVTKGQLIAAIYSPELIAAQRELIFLLVNDSGNEGMIGAAKRKLQLLGLSDGEIEKLIQEKEPGSSFGIYSPYSGYVILDNAWATPSDMGTSGITRPMGNSMGTSSSPTTPTPAPAQETTTGRLLREGDYVSAGQTLFTIVNAHSLRIELDLPASKASGIAKGTMLALDFGNGDTEKGTVDLVQPFFSEGQNFVRIRVFNQSNGRLAIGHLVNATISTPATESLWVPREAVVDLGNERIVFVKEQGVLRPTPVRTGATADNQIEIRSGIASSDEIAANAQYLVDSESFIKTAQ